MIERPADQWSVVIAWGAGKYTFRHRWQAAMFRYFARRWSGWTSWAVLNEDEKAQSIKPVYRDPIKRMPRRHRWTLTWFAVKAWWRNA